jgi:hypothetical protein
LITEVSDYSSFATTEKSFERKVERERDWVNGNRDSSFLGSIHSLQFRIPGGVVGSILYSHLVSLKVFSSTYIDFVEVETFKLSLC